MVFVKLLIILFGNIRIPLYNINVIIKKKYMKSILERNLGFMGYPDYSVDTEGNIWSIGYNNTKEIKKNEASKNKRRLFKASINN